jgi:hypothetical protein
MEPQGIFNLVSGALLVGVGWWCREIWDSVKSLKDDVQRMEVDLSKNYVSRSEINTRLDKIDQVLGRIFDKLENKADKS